MSTIQTKLVQASATTRVVLANNNLLCISIFETLQIFYMSKVISKKHYRGTLI